MSDAGTDPEATLTGGAVNEPGSTPHLRIVRGDPSDEELAALVAVVSAVSAAAAASAAASAKPRPEWSAPHRTVRHPLSHGPSGWRSSSQPR